MDHLVNIGHRNGQTDQDVTAIARLGQLELGAANHDLFAELDETVDQTAKAHLLGPPPVQRQHVDAKRALQRRVAIELVEDHFGRGVTLELDHDAHTLTVAFVANVRDAFNALFTHQIGNPFDQIGLVHLIGNGGNDDGFAIGARLFDGRHTAHNDRTPARHQGLTGPGPTDDLAARGEIGSRHDIEKLV